jgi:hypothetical protein
MVSIPYVSCQSVFLDDFKAYMDVVFADDLCIDSDLAFLTIRCVSLDSIFNIDLMVGREFIEAVDSIWLLSFSVR